MNIKRVIAPAVAAFLSLGAGAVDLRPGGAFIEGGVAKHQSYSLTAGLLWPWSWRRELGSAQVTGMTEAFVSEWSARNVDGRESLTQLGIRPMLRLRFDQGRSPWFVEGGIGISVMDKKYRTRTKEFTTSFNFTDVVGVGRSFGANRRQELSLRINHVSNGGIKVPNPGETFLQLHYAVTF